VKESDRKQRNRERLEEELQQLIDECLRNLDVPVDTVRTADGVDAAVDPPTIGKLLPNLRVNSPDPSNPTPPGLFRAAATLYEEYVLVPRKCPPLVAYEVALGLAMWALLSAQSGDLDDAMALAGDARRAFDAPDLGLGQNRREQQRRFAHEPNKERQSEARIRHARWLQEDERLREESPHLTSKRGRAKAIRRALNEEVAADRIARLLPRR
jgi:hypothetical protein